MKNMCTICLALAVIAGGLFVKAGDSSPLIQLLDLSEKEISSQRTGGYREAPLYMGALLERDYRALQRSGSFTQLQARTLVSSNEVVDILANNSVSDVRKAILVRAITGLDKDSYERLLNDVLKRNKSQNLNPVLLTGLLFPSTKHLRDSWTTHPYSAMRVEFTREAAMVFAANTNMATFFTEKLREDERSKSSLRFPSLVKVKDGGQFLWKGTTIAWIYYFAGTLVIVGGVALVGIITYRKVNKSKGA